MSANDLQAKMEAAEKQYQADLQHAAAHHADILTELAEKYRVAVADAKVAAKDEPETPRDGVAAGHLEALLSSGQPHSQVNRSEPTNPPPGPPKVPITKASDLR